MPMQIYYVKSVSFARQHAMHAQSDIVLPILYVCLSVRLSVRPMPVLCLNE